MGPPYAILDVSPPHGPMTGGTPISVRGAGFTAGSICVRFSAGEFFVDVPGTFISTTEIRAVTPNVKAALGESKHHFSQLPHLSLKKQTSDKSPHSNQPCISRQAADCLVSLCITGIGRA